MKPAVERLLDRRSFFTSMGKAAAGASAFGLLTDADIEAAPANVQRNSIPSDLKITDLRVAVVEKAPMTCPLIRLDTNQGLVGYGEVRDGASATYALFLKSRLLGENPCNVDRLFRRIKQFGAPARQAGGVCGVEMALWDLAGKAYGVPAYQMLGGKFRDKVRLYADTTETEDPHEQGRRLKKRMESGFTWLKQDFGIDLLKDVPGALAMPQGSSVTGGGLVMHPFTGIEITDKGIAFLSDWVGAIRQEIGMDIPLASDHYGHIGVNSCIRLARAMEKHQLAWMEDMVPWQLPELMKQIKDAVDIPILTGEDIYLKEDFAKLITVGAVDIIHPDLASAGGLLEMKKISDFAMEHGVPMAMHFAGTPVSFMANLHTAVAVENFLVLEILSVVVPWWQDLVSGVT
jgi:L-alanine-DL-glutamate epimerase-like enolase superfamily enzyme